MVVAILINSGADVHILNKVRHFILQIFMMPIKLSTSQTFNSFDIIFI